jgi:hypothetical protein
MRLLLSTAKIIQTLQDMQVHKYGGVKHEPTPALHLP